MVPGWTVVSLKVMLPVSPRAGATAIWVNGAPPVADRSMTKPLSLVALSVHVSLTCGPACRVAVEGRRSCRGGGRKVDADRRRERLDGHGRVRTAVADACSWPTTRYRYAVLDVGRRVGEAASRARACSARSAATWAGPDVGPRDAVGRPLDDERRLGDRVVVPASAFAALPPLPDDRASASRRPRAAAARTSTGRIMSISSWVRMWQW